MTRDELRTALQGVPVGHLRVKVAMTLLGESQHAVARKIGLSQGTVCYIVNGTRDVEPTERGLIAKALGLTVADLFGEEALIAS
jgi:transcriptional regulator with XRE-family HTH domain